MPSNSHMNHPSLPGSFSDILKGFSASHDAPLGESLEIFWSTKVDHDLLSSLLFGKSAKF